MVKELHLEGCELITYAIISGFFDYGYVVNEATLAYIGEWTGKSGGEVQDMIDSLEERGLLCWKTTDIIAATYMLKDGESY